MQKVAPTTARETSEHWTERAGRFNAAASHLHHMQAWTDLFRSAIGPAPLQVADLGCGTGGCALALAEIGHQVTGVDGSAGMLAIARKDAQARGLIIEFVEAQMDEAALPQGAFDIVTLRNVLWTLEKPAAALHLARGLLRTGGRVLLSDGAWYPSDAAQGGMPDFYARLPFRNGLTEGDARNLLREAGFESPTSWQHLFAEHPYDLMGRPEFFVLTARRGA